MQQGGPLTFMNGGVAVSADGNTVIVGDFGHDNDVGGALIFTRTNGTWTNRGPNLRVPAPCHLKAACIKARLSLCQRTGTQRSLAARSTAVMPAVPYRYSLESMAFGASKAQSWWSAVV